MQLNERQRNLWWNQPKNKAHDRAIAHCRSVERRQSRLFDKFLKLDGLYDPNSIRSDQNGTGTVGMFGVVTENVVASNVDTVTAAVAATDVRARFMTDDGDWSTQRTARHLEWYSDGLSSLYDVDIMCRMAFKSAAIKGTGLVHVFVDGADKLHVEHCPVDEIVVDEAEAHNATPSVMHRRRGIDRDELKARYPGNDDAIDNSQASQSGLWRLFVGLRPIDDNEVILISSWRLPVGKKGQKGYRPGRYIESIDGTTLYDVLWEEPFFPVARFAWSEPTYGWYGIGGAERIAGHQRALNRRNWQIDRLLNLGALPTTYVRKVDAGLRAVTHELGMIAVVNGDIPQTVHAPLVNKETYQSRDQLKASAFEEFGVSRMAAQSMKPAGLDSGEALREYRDQTTQRFSIQEKGFEKLKLDVVWLMLFWCKRLGANAPTIQRRTRFGAKKIKWSDVDMGDVKVQIVAASTISKTPAGRTQTVIEWAQAGVITQDEARRLIRHPDLERAMSVYTAALEAIEQAFEEIEDGKVVMPEPYDNLQMAVWRGQMEYLKIRGDGAPEEILEALRQYIVQAAWIMTNPTAQAANDQAMVSAPDAAGAQPGMPQDQMAQQMPPGAAPPGGPPQLPGGPPTNAPAVAAFAPQAMRLQAI